MWPKSTDLQSLAAGKPILLWLTDRSRYVTGLKCRRQRLLEYHWGPHGYGIKKGATKVPLATGDVIHRGLGNVLDWVRQHDTIPPATVVDAAVNLALQSYQQIIDTRGLLHWDDDPTQQQRVVDEQCMLIEGLIRGWTLWVLPELLKPWRVVYVESERISVCDCTCGLGDRLGGIADHVSRGCEGIGIQTRCDWIGEHRQSPQTYSYHEFKSVGQNDARFREEYETDMQPYLGQLGIEDELGIEVQQTFIHGLVKGKYDREYVAETKLYEGPEYQNSRLCYAYCDSTSTAGMDRWMVKYQWKDEKGVGHKLPKAFKRRPVSEYGNYQEYLQTFAEDLRPQVVVTLGPFPRKDAVREKALNAWVAEERRIRWALFEFADRVDEYGDWAHPEVQAFLDEHFPCSFDCQRYGGRYKCHYIPVCHAHAGWENPQELLGYVPRRPHHAPEEIQAVQRGLLAPLAATESTE